MTEKQFLKRDIDREDMYEDATVIDLIKIDIEINTSKRTTAAATTTILIVNLLQFVVLIDFYRGGVHQIRSLAADGG